MNRNLMRGEQNVLVWAKDVVMDVIFKGQTKSGAEGNHGAGINSSAFL